ncbi:MAG: MFS transporter [Steroidobacteraceae bacterium]|nr:MFS transporter [Nevskiaceae bacterium]MCP5359717.1 MFS transporter [Nevskiaceae bacterium]MCP5472793.1 MFS transporter [Nevskiaceae bacterium]
MKPLLTLFIVCVIDVLGFGVIVPLIPYIGSRFEVSTALITAILGVHALCQLIAAPVWGRLSDRYGRRPILMVSLCGACVSYAMLGFAPNIEWVLASRVLGGLMAGNISAAMAYASDISTPEQRTKALGTVGAAIGIGFMLGPAIGGILAGDNLATASFVRPGLVAMALSLFATILVARFLPESHTVEHRVRIAGVTDERRTPLALLRRLPGLRYVTLAALCIAIAQAIFESIFALWALARFGYGPRTVGLLMFALAIVPVTMQGALVRVLAPRFGEHRLAIAGVAGFVVGMVIAATAPGIEVALVGLAIAGAGSGAFSPSGSALASMEASGTNRGSVLGTYQTSSSLGRVIGPFISGAVFARFGAGSPLLLGALIAAPAALAIVLSKRSVASR